MKKCTKCKQEKSLSDFSKQKKSKDGHSWYCKSCKNSQSREYYKTEAGISAKKRHAETPTRYRVIKHRYGLSKEEYHSLIERFAMCQLCGAEFTGREPMIDHCHETGKVRGLLCLRCNTMLGYARDDIEILKRGISYLEATASSAECEACGSEGSDAALVAA